MTAPAVTVQDAERLLSALDWAPSPFDDERERRDQVKEAAQQRREELAESELEALERYDKNDA